ncbi:MAG: hypothetical protein OI74_08975 [Gammaproteobacteria bacterium (ex Lamellibrachia satsuma)]|nr:MAG: right-handed parallel beta-helix repeat-containing protein [Gammaproteobacteria bacterium (ex Lamellibrachia satsuma)]RRS33205.1 MAG: hypothetical protein OI74_08975 [Gammaproteobacteria bacterium (ex Lamellibrachia satsuma)]RRS36350.1 MAG: hypothetical protein NV67_07765 [Gammaproteobacteria bacterium (ex Lamellibrachia satsuma)]
MMSTAETTSQKPASVVTATRSPTWRWLYGRDADYNQIINCRFIGAHDPNGSSKTGLFFEQADHNHIVNNLFDGTTQDNLSLVKSDSNLVQGNRFRNGKHTLWSIKYGNKNIIRGNDLSPLK